MDGYTIVDPPAPNVIGEEPASISTTTADTTTPSPQEPEPDTTTGYDSSNSPSTGGSAAEPISHTPQEPEPGTTTGYDSSTSVSTGAFPPEPISQPPQELEPGATTGDESSTSTSAGESLAEPITQPPQEQEPDTTTGYDSSNPPSTDGSPAEPISQSPQEQQPSTTGYDSSTSPSSNTSPSPAEAGTQRFTFVQLQTNVYKFTEEHFLRASFDKICPSQNCFNDCKNLTQVFVASPGAFDHSTDMDPKDVHMTLFGVCSNLANATAVVKNSDNTTLKSYFKSPSPEVAGDIGLITSNLTMCLVDTCESTRNPAECQRYCRPDHLLLSQDTLSISPGIYQCAHQLCQSTCGLPYADQDVFGIGVLISYYIQAVLLLLLALVFVTSAAVQAWRHRRSPTAPELGKPVLNTFLNTQCYFGASAAVAACFMHPAKIDPLNGYPLVTVALMGCIGPVFTLSLFSSHSIKFRSSMPLCIMSWVLNTVVFFRLVLNLSRSQDDHSIVDQAIRSLSETNLCGGSTATVLCQEWIGSNPLQSLSRFFNKDSVPNISNVPLVWAITAVAMIILTSSQAYRALKASGMFFKEAPQTLGPDFRRRRGILQRLAKGLASPWASFVILLPTVSLFALALAYEYVMVRAYQEMDVIDMNGWTFGQVVAVLFWAPPLFDVVQSLLASLKKDNPEQEPVRAKYKDLHMASYEDYRHVAHSPALSPGIDTRDDSEDLGTSMRQDAQTESGLLQHQRALWAEEGRN